MSLFHKIRLALNVATEGLQWYLPAPGDAPGPAFGMLTPATHHSVPFSSDRRIAGRELRTTRMISVCPWKHRLHCRTCPSAYRNFEKLREGNYLYVDKTELIYRLVSSGCYYFLSRPRRFGKSLLMSTIHSYFSGRKDLFEGLAIEKLEKEWLKHPVLHLDLNTQKYDCKKALNDVLEEFVVEQESIYGRNPAEKGLGRRFQGIIRHAYEKTGRKSGPLHRPDVRPGIQAGLQQARNEGLEQGRAEGLAEGKAEGLAEGKAEGKAEGRSEVARAMLGRGMDIAVIADVTGLSAEQIRAL